MNYTKNMQEYPKTETIKEHKLSKRYLPFHFQQTSLKNTLLGEFYLD